MIIGNAELHNFAEGIETPGTSGVRLQRVPELVRDRLEEPARARVLNPAGAEIRFVPADGPAKVTLSSDEGEGTARVFFGPFQHGPAVRFGREPVEISITMEESTRTRFDSLPPRIAETLPFSPRIIRIVLFGGMVRLHGIQGALRPPGPGETPERTMLAYGTSITHGAAATSFHLSYAAQTAWRLGTDLLNFGVGGACLCEAAFGDYLASLGGWDFATLALSVNMIGRGFTVAEFADRVRYLVGKIAGDNPGKPVACISIYPYFGDWADLQPDAKGKPDDFRKALRDVVGELGFPNLTFIDGRDILTDIAGLTTDLIHPGDLGMIRMGENLAGRLAAVIGGSK